MCCYCIHYWLREYFEADRQRASMSYISENMPGIANWAKCTMSTHTFDYVRVDTSVLCSVTYMFLIPHVFYV